MNAEIEPRRAQRDDTDWEPTYENDEAAVHRLIGAAMNRQLKSIAPGILCGLGDLCG